MKYEKSKMLRRMQRFRTQEKVGPLMKKRTWGKGGTNCGFAHIPFAGPIEEPGGGSDSRLGNARVNVSH